MDAILRHVSEPLLSLHVGELSRSLYPNPRMLVSNGEHYENAMHVDTIIIVILSMHFALHAAERLPKT